MLGATVTVALAAVSSADVSSAEIQFPAKIAVIDFDYLDSSGEPRDQTAEHRARMAAFMSKLRADLAAGGIFAPVTIACADPPCTAVNTPPAPRVQPAKPRGARLLV